MTPEERFLAHLGLIDRIVAHVCRRNHWDGDEAQEFSGYVRLKLIDRDYAVIAKFEGRSTFATYLVTVVQRLAFQYRVELWGKWRPSAEAQRLGQAGILLERLLTRDGYSFDEAMNALTTGRHRSFTRAELEAIYLRLPQRRPRPVLVHDVSAARNVPGRSDADAGVVRTEREHLARRAMEALDGALATLSDEDQLIIRMRFWSGRSVRDIAGATGITARRLYKRLEHVIRILRRSLQDAGLAASDISDVLDADICIDEGQAVENERVRPSNREDVRPSQDSDKNDRSRFSR